VPDESSGQRVSRHDEQGGQWTSVYELDRRRQLHHIGVAKCRRHCLSRKLLPACPVHQIEWTFVCHKRRCRNGSTGKMRRPLLQYGLLYIVVAPISKTEKSPYLRNIPPIAMKFGTVTRIDLLNLSTVKISNF